MTKRKIVFDGIHEDGVVRKKARKKTQAFGVPKTAAIKAIIKRNETESALLRLPLEIRRRIWAFALGDQLIHVRKIWPWDHWDYYYTCSDSDLYAERETQWSTTRCISPYTETELFERSKRTVEELADADEAELGLFTDRSRTRLYDIESTTEERKQMRRFDLEINPHFCCRDIGESLEESPESTEEKVDFLPTQILRACRQVYIEANPIMWKTNTFSFAHAEDFKHFMHERTTAQKASISKLRFDINWTYGARASREWETHACQLGLIRSLRGLRSLDIHIEQDYAALAAKVGYDLAKSDYWEWCFDAIAKFRILPLQRVNVVLTNGRHAKEDDKISHADRVTIAERVRQRLLDPEGAKNFEEQQAQEAKRRAEGFYLSGWHLLLSNMASFL